MDNEIKDIVKGLLEKSKRREVNWIHSGDIYPMISPDAEDYVVNLERSTIEIFRSAGDTERITFLIKNISGKEIIEEALELFDVGYSDLEELINLAANKADNVDDTLDSIKDELNTSGEIGIIDNNNDDIPF